MRPSPQRVGAFFNERNASRNIAEGTVARCAISVIRFVEGDGRHWSDRAIKGLHIRLCRATGLPRLRFEAARDNLVRELFIPL